MKLLSLLKGKYLKLFIFNFYQKKGDSSSLINAHGTVIESGTEDHTSIKEVRTIVENMLEEVLKVKSSVIGVGIRKYLGKIGN